MNYSDKIFNNLYTFTVLIILLISIHKEVQETLLLTQDFLNSHRLWEFTVYVLFGPRCFKKSQ